MNPGAAKRPSSSITSVPAPISASTSSLLPTATIHPSWMASASAMESSGSTVATIPPRRTMSAGVTPSPWAGLVSAGGKEEGDGDERRAQAVRKSYRFS